MDLLPISLGTRPRLAVELRAEGVVAARSEDALALVSAVSYRTWPAGTVLPGLKAGNVMVRTAAVAAVKKSLEAVALKERQTTLVMPDAAMRVLLLDFDALPAKAAEALPVVRFRLKKLLPFDADEAMVSYQIMSTQKGLVRVLAVAVPKDVLSEYEGVVREAGFEPGAVLPSTLAALAGLEEEDASATLLVNAGETGVTTAIVREGVLLLHRTVDLQAHDLEMRVEAVAAEAAAANEEHWAASAELVVPTELLASPPREMPAMYETSLPLVSVEDSAGEWARQMPVVGYGVLEEDPVEAEADYRAKLLAERIVKEAEAEAVLTRVDMLPAVPTAREAEAERRMLAAREVTQAVSVAAAYFEDTLQMAPGLVHSAGTLGAELLGQLLREAGIGQEEMRVMETVDPAMLMGGASSSQVPRGWMAGVRGALRS